MGNGCTKLPADYEIQVKTGKVYYDCYYLVKLACVFVVVLCFVLYDNMGHHMFVL